MIIARATQAKRKAPPLSEQLAPVWAWCTGFLTRLLNWSLALALLALMGLAGWGIWQKLQQPLTTVQVIGGNALVPDRWVQEALKPWMNQDIWQLDLAAIQHQLEQNTWLTQVFIQRVWPNRLIVRIGVHQPVARWQGTELLDEDGSVFTPTPMAHVDNTLDALPDISGPDGRQWAVWDRYLTLKQALAGIGLAMTGLVENSRGSLDVLLTDGVRIHLGSQDIESRLQRFLDVYPRTLSGKLDQVAAIDLRYTNGFAVQWRPGAAALTDQQTKPKT
ncbi:cell division protein FtsQ/DivIB [Halothiobacillus sp. DCM-1]|uniref:cell division protein FtsQ/DivIB n=1 Tax=Halothiobacillus sp. DCM-1 TaxID=3112558 RepID=UPI003243EC9A